MQRAKRVPREAAFGTLRSWLPMFLCPCLFLLRTDGLDYFLGGVGHGVGGGELEVGLGEGLFACLDVVAFEADDERE